MQKLIIKIFIVFLISAMSLPVFVFSQDIHFSQFYASPLNLNPAKAGYFMGSHRFTGNFKNQWRSVTTPYRTFSAAFDMQLLQRSHKQDMIGGGVLFNTDRAGDANYGTTQINFALSYIKALNRLNNHFISFGIQPGITQRSFNNEKLIFDSQHDGVNYNPNLPHGEVFDREGFVFYDFSAGVYWNHQIHKNLGFDAGFSLYHINKPNQSFYEDPSAVLNRKYLLFANSIFQIYDGIDAIPGFFYAHQGNFKEVIVGSSFRYIIKPNPYDFTTFNLGLFFRMKDAAIIIAGFDYLQYNLGVSYDINYSDLKPASRHLGGLELALKYMLDVKKTYVKKTPCPIF